MKNKLIALSAFALASPFALAEEGLGAAAVKAVQDAAKDANPVYVAVIAALAGFFVVKLIRKAL